MITTPTLILDERKCRKNIDAMVETCKTHQLSFRPHFKTHQSLEIGRWFKKAGVSKITVSSLAMAEYFSEEWQNITVAFPVNILEIRTIIRLSKKIQLNVLVESVETAHFLNEHLTEAIGGFIKVNIGNNRTGLSTKDHKTITSIIMAIESSPFLNFKGFLGHAGQTYACRSKQDIIETHLSAKLLLTQLKLHYIKDYPYIKISYGDTPSCSVATDFSGIDEIRPGNFVFYDIMQYQIGSCDIDDIAVAMACPIVSIHNNRNEIVVYGGGIHFSKDRIQNEKNNINFGQLVAHDKKGWHTIIEGAYLRSLSQEHGVITFENGNLSNYELGDLVYILPVHSCMTANLMKSYTTLTNNEITMFNSTT